MVLGTEQALWSPMTSLWHCLMVLQCAGSWAGPVVFFDIPLVSMPMDHQAEMLGADVFVFTKALSLPFTVEGHCGF